MCNHAALVPLPEISSGKTESDPSRPTASWKLGILVLNGLPNGPAAWALRNPSEKTVLRGWINAESGRAAVQLPMGIAATHLEVRSSSERWTVELPPRRP